MICIFETGEKNRVKMFKILEWSGISEEDKSGNPVVTLYVFNWKLFRNQLCLIKDFKYKNKFWKFQLSAAYLLP